ncbi:MAG: hypothetical protein Q4E03_05230 [Trueperella sp.]|nr:hypothetical protein [Trueperella sp.]
MTQQNENSNSALKRGSELHLIRLLAGGGNGGRARFVGVVIGVALGMALLLLLLGAGIGIGERESRGNWYRLSSADEYNWRDITETPLQRGEFAVVENDDFYLTHKIKVVWIAAGPNSPTAIPGLSQLPENSLVPGTFAVSPALAELVDINPQLTERYGTMVGTLGEDALEGPESKLVVILRSEQQIASSYSSILTNFSGRVFDSMAYQNVAIIGAISVLLPVALLISLASSLGAVQRAERFATLRLLGATPAQVGKIAAAESAAAAALGSAIGIALYFAVIPLAAQFQIHGTRFFWRDLVLNPLWIIGAVLAVVGVSALAAAHRTVKADVGPLGITRERTEKPVRLTGLIVLAAGMVGLYVVYKYDANPRWANQFLWPIGLIASFLAIVTGMLAAGPLITQWMAKLGSRLARGASSIIAFNHMERHPRRVFNSVAGIVLATYLVTVFSYGISAAGGDINEPAHRPDQLSQSLLYLRNDADAAVDLGEISAIPGVTAVAIGRHNADHAVTLPTPEARALGFKVADDGAYAILPDIWPYNPVPETGLTTISDFVPASYDTTLLFVKTNGRSQVIEQTRTELNKLVSTGAGYAKTPDEVVLALADTSVQEFANLAYIGIMVTVALSTLVVIVSVITSLLNRKRQFILLKLTGMQRRVVTRVTFLETLIPLAGVFMMSVGLGIYTSWGLIEGLSTVRKIGAAPVEYYVVLMLCLLLAVLASVVTAQAARRMLAGNQVPRYE